MDVDAAISPAGYGIKQHMLVDLVIQSYGPARRVALVPDLPCPIRKPQRSARLALIPIHISARKCTAARHGLVPRSDDHTSELLSLMRISYAVFCLKKKTHLSDDIIID